MYYGTVQGFKDHHNKRGNSIDIVDFTDEEIEINLLVGSEWLDAKYRSSLDGLKNGGREQVREFPRSGHFDFYGYAVSSETVPDEVNAATYELALKHGKEPGSLSVDFTPNQFKQVSVDGAVSVTYLNYSDVQDIQTEFATVKQFMSGLIGSQNNTSGLTGSLKR